MGKPSVTIAKTRVSNLISSDRIQCSVDTTERMENDLYHTLSKYLSFAKEDFEVQITRSEIHIRITGENN